MIKAYFPVLDKKNAKALVSDKDATPANLLNAVGIDVLIDRRVARHQNTSPDVLERLSHSSDKPTRKGVVMNPNASKEVLVRLAPQFPGNFFKNTIFDWLLIEDPELLTSMGKGVLKNILKRPDCPESFFNWAVEYGDQQQKLALAMNLNAPEEMLRSLIRQGGTAGIAAQGHIKIQENSSKLNPKNSLEESIKHGLKDLDLEDAKRSWSREYIGPAQWLHLSPVVRLGVIGIKCFGLIDSSLSLDIGLRRKAAQSLSSTAQILQRLSFDTNESVRSDVADNPNTPLLLLQGWANDENEEMRSAVAYNSSTPFELLEMLSNDESSEVRQSVAANQATPTFILEKLIQDEIEFVRHEVPGNHSTPVSLLEKLSRDEDAVMRWKVAYNPNTTVEILRKLSSDNDESVQHAVARNLKTPTSILEQLSYHENDYARSGVACNHIASAELLERLSHDKVSSVRQAVASNQNIPVALLRTLSLDEDPKVRIEVIKNPSTPIETVEKLAFDKQWEVRQWAPGNPTEPSVWSSASNKFARQVSTVLAGDPLTSTGTLAALADLRDSGVQWALIGNPSTPSDVRERVQVTLISKESPSFITATSLASVISKATPSFLREIALNEKVSRQLREEACAFVWWHEIKLLSKRYSFCVLPVKPNTEELIALFQAEINFLLNQPEESLTAKLLGSKALDLLSINPLVSKQAAKVKGTITKGDRDSKIRLRPERLLGLCNEGVEVAELVKSYRSVNWVERLAVASNLTTPANILKTLKNDSHQLVSQQARSTEGIRAENAVMKFDEKSSFDKMGKGLVDFPDQQSLGACPKCAGEVYARGSNYECINSLISTANPQASCNFKTGINLLQQPISHEQLRKLLSTGRTDLLDGFVLSRTQKKFKAMLVWDAKADKVIFEIGSMRRNP